MGKKKTKTEKPTLADCQRNSFILADMLEGIDLMHHEGEMFSGPCYAITIAALERANSLANALDGLELADVK